MATKNRNPIPTNATVATGATLTASSGKKRKKKPSNGEDNNSKREDYDNDHWQQKIKEGIHMYEEYKMKMTPSQVARKIKMKERAFKRKLDQHYKNNTTLTMKTGPKPKKDINNSTKNNDECNVDGNDGYTNDDDNGGEDNHGNDSDDDDGGGDDDKLIIFHQDLQKFLKATTNNANLVKQILEEHGQQNSKVYDLTYGDGKFWSGNVIKGLELIVRFDRFKNKETDPQKYGNVYPLRLAGTHTVEGNFFKGATCAVVDPPYLPFGGKHNARNCNLSKSSSFLKFAFAYGIDVFYTKNNIAEFYIDCFEIVEKSLCDNGEGHLVLVKCMDFESVVMTEIVGSIAACKGYQQVGYYALKKQGKKQSVMLCYQRMSTKQRKNSFLRIAMGSQWNMDNVLKKYKKKSANDYQERTKSTIDDTERWMYVCGRILNKGVHCRQVIQRQTMELMHQYGWVQEENEWRRTNETLISSKSVTPGTDLQEFYRDRCFENTMIQNCCYVLWHDLLEKEYDGNIPTDRNIKIQYAKTLFDKTSSDQLNTKKSHCHIKKNVEIIMEEYFKKL